MYKKYSLGDIDNRDVKLFTEPSLLDLPGSILIDWIFVSENQRRKGLATDAMIVELKRLQREGFIYIEATHTDEGAALFMSLEDRGLIEQVNIYDLSVTEEALTNAEFTGMKVYKITVGGLGSVPDKSKEFILKIEDDLQNKIKYNKRSIEKLAAGFGITDKTQVKEFTELAIVRRARELAHSGGSVKERFDKIVELYHSQVNLSHRTSQSILLQQYSTPAPIAFLAGVFCEVNKAKSDSLYFEPSAGNGLLTIAGNPKRFIVNEIDQVRNSNLQRQGYFKVIQQDATKVFQQYYRRFDAVITNPPFGKGEAKKMWDTFPIQPLEHIMALTALDTMNDSGKAAIIIGGHTRWDDKGRIQAGKNRIFFNYLYSRYNVVDVIMIDGHKLYSRQGTSFDVRLILIDGRKPVPVGNAPLYTPHTDVVIKSFDELFERVISAMDVASNISVNQNENKMRLLELEAEALELELQLLKANASSLGVLPNKEDLVLGNGNMDQIDLEIATYGGSYFLMEESATYLDRSEVGSNKYWFKISDLKVADTYNCDVRKKILQAAIDSSGYNAKELVLLTDGFKNNYITVQMVDEVPAIKNTARKLGFDGLKVWENEDVIHPSLIYIWNNTKLRMINLPNDTQDFGAIIPGNIDHRAYALYQEYRNKYKEHFRTLVLVKRSASNNYETFDLDAERLIHMFSVPLTLFALIKGKKVYGITLDEEKLFKIKTQLNHAGYVIEIVDDIGGKEINQSNPNLSGVNYLYRDGTGDDEKMFKEWSRLKKAYPDSIILLEEATTFQTFDYDAYALYNVRKKYDFRHGNPKVYFGGPMRCHGLPYFAKEGLIREERPLIEHLLLQAGFKPLFIENEKSHYKWPTRKELEQYELERGQAHNAKDKDSYRIWVQKKDHSTKNVLFIKRGVRFYTTWDTDAEVAKQLIHYRSSDEEKSIRDLFGHVVKGIRVRVSVLKDFMEVFEEKGYTVLFADENNNDKGLGKSDDITDYIDDDGNVRYSRMFDHYKRIKAQNPHKLVLFETPDTYTTFDEDAKELAKVCNIRLIECTGFEYSVTAGISKITRYVRFPLITDAGYEILLIENGKGTDIEAMEFELQAWKQKFGKAHAEEDLRDFEQWLQISDQQERTIYFFPNKKEQTYTAWGRDAQVVSYYCKLFTNKSLLYEKNVVDGIAIKASELKKVTKKIEKNKYQVVTIGETLGAPYEPASNACIKLDTQVPDSMAYETHSAVNLIAKEVGGDIDNFVRHRLNYPTKAALCKVLSAEQIDAVAMAIYNIEARNQGMIIGDQTGIGKGRIAAAMIRYGVLQGNTPMFLTEKANLFSDIYRDLKAIGSGHLKPFIVNSREPKTDIKDEDGNVVYQAPAPTEQQSIFESRQVPSKYDFVLGTYTQFNSAEKKPVKPNFLRAIAEDNIFIMDEAHNSSGSSNTGEFMQGVIRNTKGVVFLSATFAKRPDNMPIYAMKTAIADCNMTRDDLVDAITSGGVALQEVLSSQLVAEGQMLRRERSYEGIEVNYITLDNKAQEHKAIADNITGVLRDIISFQTKYVDKEVKDLDKIAAAQNKEVELREGTSKAGVDNIPYFSKVFNVINQMLFSLKAEAVAEKAIERLREGKKPVIAFASTMGSFIETLENETGMPVGDGDTVDADFAEVLRRGLEGIMRFTEKGIDGNSDHRHFNITDFPVDAQIEYQRISERIESVATGITISPIDVVVRKIKQAGYTVAEVTGRKFELQFDKSGRKALVLARRRINTNDAFRMFNNNEVDVLMINQSGSTGASAHAIPTAKVSKDQIRQRVMIVLQAELDISTEVQKRGRINRTGQILKPIYDYVSSAIPAEKRLMMMLQKKLKSLDANTTSNQKQSSSILSVPDFLNKYGDKIVQEYLADNPEVNKLLDDPLNLEDAGSDSGGKTAMEDAAMRVSGRVAVLSTQMQEEFYTDISERYNDYVEYLKQVGEYDLEVEAMNLEAETISVKVIKMGKGTDSPFGDDSVLETIKANVLKKPFSKTELENLLKESLKEEDPKVLQQKFLQEYSTEIENKLEELAHEVDEKYDSLIKEIPSEKSIKKLEDDEAAWNAAIKARTKELEDARLAQHTKNEKTFENRSAALKKALNYFYIGRYVSYPIKSFGSDDTIVPAVFLGYMIDRKKKNPYAPSAIKLRFAIANSSKYLAIPASYSQDIMSIIGASVDLKEVDIQTLLNGWHNYIQERSVDRATRHIITGNLLQAFSDQKGKLVSYTTNDGQVKKGILMPEHWNAGEELQDKVVVPVLKALPIIRSLVSGHHIVTNNGLSIFKNGSQYKLIISASRSKGGDIYLDKDILPLVNNNNFEKTSDKMVAVLPEANINRLVEVLQQNHSCSITIQSYQLKDINKESIRHSSRKRIEPPTAEQPENTSRSSGKLRILELEAEALELELLLLAA